MTKNAVKEQKRRAYIPVVVAKPSESAPFFFYLNHLRKYDPLPHSTKIYGRWILDGLTYVSPRGVLFDTLDPNDDFPMRHLYEERMNVSSRRLGEILNPNEEEKYSKTVRCVATMYEDESVAPSYEDRLVCKLISAGLMLDVNLLNPAPIVFVFDSKEEAEAFKKAFLIEKAKEVFKERFERVRKHILEAKNENEAVKVLNGELFSVFFARSGWMRPVFVCTENEKYDNCLIANSFIEKDMTLKDMYERAVKIAKEWNPEDIRKTLLLAISPIMAESENELAVQLLRPFLLQKIEEDMNTENSASFLKELKTAEQVLRSELNYFYESMLNETDSPLLNAMMYAGTLTKDDMNKINDEGVPPKEVIKLNDPLYSTYRAEVYKGVLGPYDDSGFVSGGIEDKYGFYPYDKLYYDLFKGCCVERIRTAAEVDWVLATCDCADGPDVFAYFYNLKKSLPEGAMSFTNLRALMKKQK